MTNKELLQYNTFITIIIIHQTLFSIQFYLNIDIFSYYCFLVSAVLIIWFLFKKFKQQNQNE